MSEQGEANSWKPTDRQVQRAERSRAILRRHEAPTYPGPLYVADDEEVDLRGGPEVARRMLALWVVVLRSEGMPRDEALALVERLGLREAVSPQERTFLQDPQPDEGTCTKLDWRLESIWVLLWALGRVEALDWPSGMCDVPRLVELVKPYESDLALTSGAHLRPKEDILDAQDLTMRVHWAIRDAWLKSRMIPEGLDWSTGDELVPVATCPAVGVVEQRHHALNWLVRFLDADWDDVDTPT
jgi:hypothetical protein